MRGQSLKGRKRRSDPRRACQRLNAFSERRVRDAASFLSDRRVPRSPPPSIARNHRQLHLSTYDPHLATLGTVRWATVAAPVMEDVEFARSHSNSPLPEAGNEPDDPLAPEVEEENGVNPPLGAPDQDMEVTEPRDEMPDPDDIQEGGLSDNESVLSELDDQQFEEFDEGALAIEERPAQVIDGENMGLIGVHKRKRPEGEGDAPKKKKKRADKPRRKKNREEEAGGDDEAAGARKSRSRKKGRAAEADENDESLTPEQRKWLVCIFKRRSLMIRTGRQRALDEQLRAIMKPSGGSRRRKKDGIDLEGMADAEIEEMRRRMASAAEADNEGRKRGEPARHKLKLLPEVITLLNKNSIKDSIVDPETNLLEAVRFFLEPLSDGSLPAYDIQKGLFAALAKLPITKDSLVASGIGKVIMFYCKSKRPELTIRRQAERLYTDWTRPILKRSDDYRKKEFAQADYDPKYVLHIVPSLSSVAYEIAVMSRNASPIRRPAKPLHKLPPVTKRSPFLLLTCALVLKLAQLLTLSFPRVTSCSMKTTRVARVTSISCARYGTTAVAVDADRFFRSSGLWSRPVSSVLFFRAIMAS